MEDYTATNKWVTHSWLKTIWEKAHRLLIKIKLGKPVIQPPQGKNDYWVMKELGNICTTDELVRLNRVRLHQQVIFGSDIMDASGRAIDKKYLKERPIGERWSTIKFPNERPPPLDFKLWCNQIPQLRHRGQLHIGNHILKGHKIWDWSYDLEEARLYHWIEDGRADIFGPSVAEGLTTRANTWGRLLCNQQLERTGNYCTVELIGANRIIRCDRTLPPPKKTIPSSIWDILEQWESTWIWDGINSVGEDT